MLNLRNLRQCPAGGFSLSGMPDWPAGVDGGIGVARVIATTARAVPLAAVTRASEAEKAGPVLNPPTGRPSPIRASANQAKRFG
jgi:hypothetical protein